MRVFRYSVYGGFAVLCFFNAWQFGKYLPWWTILLVLLPPMVHLSLTGSMRVCRWAHVVEAVLLPLLLQYLTDAWQIGLTAVGIQVMCYSALWGVRSVPVLVSLIVAGTLLWTVRFEVIAWMPLLLAVMLALGEVVHQRMVVLVSRRRHLRRENQTLRRYLPEEIGVFDEGFTRRWMVVVFVDLTGFTQASLKLAPEAMAEVLNDFFSATSQQAAAHGGEVHKFLGDGMLCVFTAGDVRHTDRSATRAEGDPPRDKSRADVARSAVAAVILLQDELRSLNARWQAQGNAVDLGLHSGISAGYCTIGHWGNDHRRDYSVMGEAVNLASRLSDQADRNEVLVDAVVAGLVGGDCFQSPDIKSIKGMGEIQVFRPLPGAVMVC